VSRIEALYVNSGRGRPHYPVRSMLLALMFMRFGLKEGGMQGKYASLGMGLQTIRPSASSLSVLSLKTLRSSS